MIDFAWPWVFVVLPLPLLLRYALPTAPADYPGALYLPVQGAVDDAGPGTTPASRRLRLWIGAVIWVLLVAAAARPQWLGEPIELPLSGRDLILAVDVSGSMDQRDFILNGVAVTRLQMVQAIAGRFIERRAADRLALILFGSRAYLQTPLTFDRATVRYFLDDAVIGLAGRETALGDAIGLAVKHLHDQPADNRVLVLLTDGANTAGTLDPQEAAALAAQAGIRIYPIGIGRARDQRLGIRLGSGRDLDSATLTAIAEQTGGRMFTATDSGELARIYAVLDELEPSTREQRSYRPLYPLFVWPAGAAALLGFGLLLSTLRPSVPGLAERGAPGKTAGEPSDAG